LARNVAEIQRSEMYLNLCDKDLSVRKTFRAYVTSGVHERATTELFKRVVKWGDVIVDLGANTGYFALFDARLADRSGRTYAFEYESGSYCLLKNIEMNRHRNIVAVQKAFLDTVGKTALHICRYDSGYHTIHHVKVLGHTNPIWLGTGESLLKLKRELSMIFLL